MDKSMTNCHYIYSQEWHMCCVHFNAKIMKEEPCMGKWSFAKVYKYWIEDVINVCSNVQYVCKEPKREYEVVMITWNNETMDLHIDHHGIIKIWGPRTPNSSDIKNQLSFMCY